MDLQYELQLLLTPGSFLRLGNHSELTMEAAGPQEVRVRLGTGEALIEVLDLQAPIVLEQNGVTAVVRKPGLYDFDARHAVVAVYAGEAQFSKGEKHTIAGKGFGVRTRSLREVATHPSAGSAVFSWSSFRSELIAEQLRAAGARLILGLTSAGRVAPDLPLPGLVVASSAIRDEGTSYHYLAPGHDVSCPPHLALPMARELSCTGLAVRIGTVWTTDAPYRETNTQLDKWARAGALAVEMQAASLFAFGQARKAQVAVVARVSNAVDHEGSQFDTGSHDQGLTILRALTRAGRSILEI